MTLSWHRGETVVVIVAHPDDEVLGAGGTMALHVARGDTVTVVFLADGVGARGGDQAAIDRRKDAAQRASKLLGTEPPRFIGLPDNRLDEVPLLDVVQAVENVISELQPNIVYTHHHGDLNIDHVICQRAVLTACRPIPATSVNAIYAIEILSSTGWGPCDNLNVFCPNRYVDIAAVLPSKRGALEAYAEEMRPFPHARSHEAIEALARFRGAAVGLTAAEAFSVVRQLENMGPGESAW